MAKRNRKPIRNFKSLPTLLFIDIVRTIIKNMTGNANFTTPTPSLASLTTKVDDLAKKEIAARTGGVLETKEMHDARTNLEKDIVNLGLYIALTADWDEAIMLTSAYPLTAEEAAPPLRRDFWLKAGPRPGEVLAFCKVMVKAKSYIWMYYVGETETTLEKDWIFGSGTTRTRITITDLDSQTKVWIRVCGITKDGLTPWLTAEHIIVP